jgi:hypothetical protein
VPINFCDRPKCIEDTFRLLELTDPTEAQANLFIALSEGIGIQYCPALLNRSRVAEWRVKMRSLMYKPIRIVAISGMRTRKGHALFLEKFLPLW